MPVWLTRCLIISGPIFRVVVLNKLYDFCPSCPVGDRSGRCTPLLLARTLCVLTLFSYITQTYPNLEETRNALGANPPLYDNEPAAACSK